MNQQRFFSVLSTMGVIFIIFLGISYVRMMNTQGEVVVNKITVPDGFEREFGKVITKNRLSPMVEAYFLSPEGYRVGWQDFKGEYLLVNFWATWCAPCVIELPSLDTLQKKFSGEGLNIISVSLDTMRSQSQIKKFLYNRNIGEFAAYLDASGEVKKKIRMRGIPTSYLLDPDGNVLYMFEGDANWSSPEAISFFNLLLGQQN